MARFVLLTVVLAAVFATCATSHCTWNNYDLSTIPTTVLTIDQYVRGWNQSQRMQWQFALCNPQPYAACASTPASYVIEMDQNGETCDVGFDTWQTNSWRTSNYYYGAAETTFTGTYQRPGDRIAHVTLTCYPGVTNDTVPWLNSAGEVSAYKDGQGNWHFNIFLMTSLIVCDTTTHSRTPPPLPPNTTPLPPPPAPATTTPPNSACMWNGVNLNNIPVTELSLVVNSTSGVGSATPWLFSLCSPAPNNCSNAPPAYVTRYNMFGHCDVALNTMLVGWHTAFGGASATFVGSVNAPNDSIANVTLVCDPGVTHLTPFYLDPIPVSCDSNGVCTYDVRLRTNVVCAGVSSSTKDGPHHRTRRS